METHARRLLACIRLLAPTLRSFAPHLDHPRTHAPRLCTGRRRRVRHDRFRANLACRHDRFRANPCLPPLPDMANTCAPLPSKYSRARIHSQQLRARPGPPHDLLYQTVGLASIRAGQPSLMTSACNGCHLLQRLSAHKPVQDACLTSSVRDATDAHKPVQVASSPPCDVSS